MECYLVEPSRIGQDVLTIAGEEFRHCIRAARHGVGDAVLAADGTGTAYRCVIARIDAESAECAIDLALPGYGEPVRSVTLAMGLLKQHARMDWIVEKATELGVRAIVPLRTARTVAHGARLDRLRQLARAATAQSRRSRVPEVSEPRTFRDALATLPNPILLEEDAGETLDTACAPLRTAPALPCAVFVGPEGGFSEDERAAAAEAGCIASLGGRRFRSETAALAALARIIRD
jgi:16S rRNA (uracil1498-N3)-methyltransferase